MLYFAGTDWFLLSWRLLPLPTPHMVESARSSSSARVCMCVRFCEEGTHMCMSGRQHERRRNRNKRDRFKEKSKECDTEHACV